MELVIFRYADKKSFLYVFSESQSFYIRDVRTKTLQMMTFLIQKFSKFHIDLLRQQQLDSKINNQLLRRHSISLQMAFNGLQNTEFQWSHGIGIPKLDNGHGSILEPHKDVSYCAA